MALSQQTISSYLFLSCIDSFTHKKVKLIALLNGKNIVKYMHL